MILLYICTYLTIQWAMLVVICRLESLYNGTTVELPPQRIGVQSMYGMMPYWMIGYLRVCPTVLKQLEQDNNNNNNNNNNKERSKQAVQLVGHVKGFEALTIQPIICNPDLMSMRMYHQVDTLFLIRDTFPRSIMNAKDDHFAKGPFSSMIAGCFPSCKKQQSYVPHLASQLYQPAFFSPQAPGSAARMYATLPPLRLDVP